jgi:hypothetical protein
VWLPETLRILRGEQPDIEITLGVNHQRRSPLR